MGLKKCFGEGFVTYIITKDNNCDVTDEEFFRLFINPEYYKNEFSLNTNNED